MALPEDLTASDTAADAAGDASGGIGSDALKSPGATDPAGIAVASVSDGLQTDLTLLGLEDLLDLRFNDDGPTGHRYGEVDANVAGRRAGPPDGSAPTVRNADLPADLTVLGLDQLLGLQLSGATLPTLGEVAALSFDSLSVAGRDSNQRQAEGRDDDVPGNDDGETGPQLSNLHFDDGANLAVIEDEPLTEQAEANSAAAAKARSADKAHGKSFGTDGDLPGNRNGLKDETDPEDLEDARESAGAPIGGEFGTETSNGVGVNVVNGTPGDDVLNGTAGIDIINAHDGNDTLDGGAGADKLHAQNGDDVLVWDAADSQIDGGNGIDTLQVNGDADFTAFSGTINKIETIDLDSDAGANNLTLTAQDVLDFTDNGDTLTIDGFTNDSIDAGTGWTDGGVVGGYHIYTQGSGPNTATLQVDTDVSVNANILL